MKVTMSQLGSGPEGHMKPGELHDVSDALAADLFRCNAAEPEERAADKLHKKVSAEKAEEAREAAESAPEPKTPKRTAKKRSSSRKG